MRSISKALWAALPGTATAPTTVPAGSGQVGGFIDVVAVLGLCALIAWVVVRLARPEKLFLRRVPGRRNNIHPVVAVVVYLIHAIVIGSALYVLGRLEGVKELADLSLGSSLAATALGQFTLIVGSLAVGWYGFTFGLRRGMGLSARHLVFDAARAVFALLAVIPAVLGALQVTTWLMPKGWEVEHPLIEMLPRLQPAGVVAVFAIATVGAAVGEELLFRGLLQSSLRRYFRSPWPAVLIASVLFAAVHHAQPQNVPALFVLAVVLGYNYERTGRLMAPIIIHALFNAVMLVQSLLHPLSGAG